MAPAPCTHRFRRVRHPLQYAPHILLALVLKYSVHTLFTAVLAQRSLTTLTDIPVAVYVPAALSTLLLAAPLLDLGLTERRPRGSVVLKLVALAASVGGVCTLGCAYGKRSERGCDLWGGHALLQRPEEGDEVCEPARNASWMFGVLAVEWGAVLFSFLRILRLERKHNAAQAAITQDAVDSEKGEAVTVPAEKTAFCARCTRKARLHKCLRSGALTPHRAGRAALIGPLSLAAYALFTLHAVSVYYDVPYLSLLAASWDSQRAGLGRDSMMIAGMALLEACVAWRSRERLMQKEVKAPKRVWALKASRVVLYGLAAATAYYRLGQDSGCDLKSMLTARPAGEDAGQSCEAAGTVAFFYLLGIVVELSVWHKQAWARRKLRKLRAQEEGAIALTVEVDEPLVVEVVKQ